MMREKTALKLYRKLNPHARRTEATAIVENGSGRRVYDCICGKRISMSSQWPMPVRVKTWRATHRACLVKWATTHIRVAPLTKFRCTGCGRMFTRKQFARGHACRHLDPHALNTFCTASPPTKDDEPDPCASCGCWAYSCVCGALVEGDNSKHECPDGVSRR